MAMVVKNKQLTDRSIYVYLPTLEMAKEWKLLAEKSKLPISRFVIEHVENSLKQEQKKAYESRAELLKQLKEKNEEIAKLRKQNRMLEMLSENQEKELKRYRAKPFAEDKFEGVRSFDKELINVLKNAGTVDSDDILKLLNVDPKDTDIVKGVSRQLHLLQAYGLAEPTPRGWRWLG
jgi:septal ring factor EnvC (AmiA/AmiB activator)